MKTPDINAKRILVVEDEPTICDICQRVLVDELFEVDIAINGKVALDMIEDKQNYHSHYLLLIDIGTPEVNGKELYRWLQEKYPVMANRVIFTTGSVMDGDTMTFMEQTGRPFLPKPFTPDELRVIVRESWKKVEKWLKNDKKYWLLMTMKP